jgi:hypothetical protein
MRPGAVLKIVSIALVIAAVASGCAEGAADKHGEEGRQDSRGARASQPEWGEPEEVTRGTRRAEVVIGSDGIATVVWADRHGLRSRSATSGQSWRPVRTVPRSRGYAAGPWLGVDSAGTVTAIMFKEDEWRATYELWTSMLPVGGEWTEPERLVSGPAEDLAPSGHIAVGEDGSAVLAYTDETDVLRTMHRDTGGAWSRPTPLANASFPILTDLTVDTDGLATVVYRQIGGHLGLAQYAESQVRHRVSLPMQVADEAEFRIASARPGEVVVLWRGRDDSLNVGRFHNQRFRQQRRLVADAGPVLDIVVAAAPDGAATFAWATGDPTSTPFAGPVVAVHQQADGRLGAPMTVAPSGPDCVSELELHADDSGHALLSWRAVGLQAAWWDSRADAWSAPEDVSNAMSDPCAEAQAILSRSSGEVIGIWSAGSAILARWGSPVAR